MQKINIVTLGCSKNTVDSENLATQIAAQGIEILYNSDDTSAKTVVINTCGFIADAKEESVNTILSFAQAKERGEIDNLFVIGCLAERYKKDLEKEIKEVDGFFGANNLKEIVEALKINYRKELIGERVLSTPKHFAYMKISEGCDRICSFCAIPLMRGKHISVELDLLVQQAENLAKNGVKELILIAQDLSYYGLDLYKEQKLALLLERLSDIAGIERIRLHYAYPANFPFDAIEVMKQKENICNYIDIPLQHISDNVLKKMRRGYTKETTVKLLDKFRELMPEMAIRTTLLVGHPGETEQDFEELKEFVKKYKFDRLGVFTYSEEEDTFGAKNYKDNISKKVKQQRADEIMEIQERISYELNQDKIGKVFKIIIDRIEDEFAIGRTEHDSPEVDNEVIVNNHDNKIEVGKFYQVKIYDSSHFDLHGELVNTMLN